MRTTTHLSDAELVRLADREAPADRLARWTAHLARCGACTERYDALTRLMADTELAVRSGNGSSATQHLRSRAGLALRLSAADQGVPPRAENRALRLSSAVARWSTVAAAIVAVFLTARVLRSRQPSASTPAHSSIERDALPISSVTPGATEDVSVHQLCQGDRRGASQADPATRERILRDYGMTTVPEHEYELDYLITPALGGTNDRRNLWPERYTDRTWNAKVKDQLEDLLPALVCEGKVDLRTAQQDIAANWVAAYKKYFKTDVPLRPGA
ncbi:MAG: hypothetical protein ABI634_10085 [Acidobacteriota bacterium]